jgi:hypothetical protein
MSPTSEKDRIDAANNLNTYVEKSGLKEIRDGLNSLNDFKNARENKLSGIAILDFIAKAEKQGSFNERMVDLAMSGMGLKGTYQEKLKRATSEDYANKSVFLSRLQSMLEQKVDQQMQNAAPAVEQLNQMAKNSGLDPKAFFNPDAVSASRKNKDKRLR